MDTDLLNYTSKEELSKYFVMKFTENNTPISVNFRDLYPNLNRSDRYTHLIHTYPAKLISHIPYFFLDNDFFSRKGDTVLDPFCGTGTVLLEANLAGRNALGADANPLARMIASAKTKKLDRNILYPILNTIIHRTNEFKRAKYPDVTNIDFWFSPKVKQQLAKISMAIYELPDDEYRNFFLVCLSNCIKKVSYSDQRIAVPVKLNPNRFIENSEQYKKVAKRLKDLKSIDVIEKFKAISINNINRIDKLLAINDNIYSTIVSINARRITKGIGNESRLNDNSVDVILTSPPYAGAQKYVRSSGLSLGWLGITETNSLRILDNLSIGRENYLVSEVKEVNIGIKAADILLKDLYEINKQRAYIVGNYLVEMKDALDESIRVLKEGGYLIIVIGNNKVCGREFNTQDYFTEYIESKDLKLQFKLIDDIKSYGLMTKRNKTADIISREWILVFKK